MRVATIGECMLELSRAPDGAVRLGFGGDTLNTAIYLARLGIAVDYATALGDDPFSADMIAGWQAEGVGIKHVLRLPGRQPGLYIIRTDAAGERSFYYWRDAAPARELLERSEAAAITAALPDYDWLYVTGITLSVFYEAGRRRLADILRQQRERGGRVAFDSNYRPRGWPDAAAAQRAIAEILPCVTLALPTLDDEQALHGDRDAAACARRLRNAGVGEVVVKAGPEGCLIVTDEGERRVPAPAQLEPVDTTAAGDAFNAGYLAARIDGQSPDAAAAAANRLAAAVIGHPGAIMPRSAMPQKALP